MGGRAYGKDIIVAQLALILECCGGGGGAYREEDGNHSIMRKEGQHRDGKRHAVPSARSSMAFRTPLSNALASAGL